MLISTGVKYIYLSTKLTVSTIYSTIKNLYKMRILKVQHCTFKKKYTFYLTLYQLK